MMRRPKPILIGFFPKKTARPDSWFGGSPVLEICSVSDCISKAPEDWINHWKHNMTWWVYDTEELARSVVGDDLASYDMYAYTVFPVVFDGETESPVDVTSTARGNLAGFDFLGYDAVSQEQSGAPFSHSPLSCNRGFDQYRVNCYCLLDDLGEAWRITHEIARDAKATNTWEPGVYYLCEVHRKRKDAANHTSEGIVADRSEPSR
jgi:hypothetical protein